MPPRYESAAYVGARRLGARNESTLGPRGRRGGGRKALNTRRVGVGARPRNFPWARSLGCASRNRLVPAGGRGRGAQ
eukprot:scaffold107712_cov75-Phaeocystis_antarctica.AAC.1